MATGDVVIHTLNGSGYFEEQIISLANGIVQKTESQTLTNKRFQKRLSTVASGDITPEIDSYDIYERTVQAAAIAINNHSTSTPVNGEMLMIKIKDDGTARAVTYGTNYVDGIQARPTTTVQNKWLIIIFQYFGSDSKFHCMGTGSEA